MTAKASCAGAWPEREPRWSAPFPAKASRAAPDHTRVLQPPVVATWLIREFMIIVQLAQTGKLLALSETRYLSVLEVSDECAADRLECSGYVI